nr:DNA/RNA helicase domain-containing protein [Bradyrhizobium cosmicum]
MRSSYALEHVATEFDVQGSTLDWVGMCWDANSDAKAVRGSRITFAVLGGSASKIPLERLTWLTRIACS